MQHENVQSRRVELSELERRVLFSNPLAVPALSSLPSAHASIYLDFDGDPASQWGSYSVTTTPAYDTDGNPAAFSSTELANINEIFQRVAEKYSPFNIDVTTVRPPSFADDVSQHVVIGGDGAWTGSTAGGLSYVGSFYNSAPNTSYVFSDNLGDGLPKYVAEATAHECGHAFGLEHQSEYNSSNAKVAEYNPGTSATAPIMGDSYDAARGLWWSGESDEGAHQDDMSIIADASNGFGYRGDDYGSSTDTAKNTKFSNGKFTIAGEISSTTDRDYFKFKVTARGSLTIKLRAFSAGAMLDGRLRLYKSDGTLLGNADDTTLSETITKNVNPGTYYAAVMSHGSYGDVGQYALFVYDAPAAASTPASTPQTHAMDLFSAQPVQPTLAEQVGVA